MERVSTSGLNQTLLSSAMSVQARMAQKQIQQSSGLVATTYGDLGSKSASLISLESQVSQFETWSATTQTAADRVQIMYSTLTDMGDLVTDLRSNLTSASADVSGTDYAAIAEGLLEDFANLLNLQMDGRYLFAGGMTTTRPVPDDAAAYPVPTTPFTTADTSYYAGDDAMATVRTSEHQTIDYGITADNAAFEKAIRAFSIIANTASPIAQTELDAAYDLATEALDGILAVQTDLSVTAGRLETAQSHQSATLVTIKDMVSDIKSVDIAAVTVQVAQYESLLQASYSALATIGDISLTDYL